MEGEMQMSKKAIIKPKTKHHMEIGIKKSDPSQVLAARKVRLRDRFLNAIFGRGHNLVVLVPGESVNTISITEMEVHELKKSDEQWKGVPKDEQN
jgi:hypothetical protein